MATANLLQTSVSGGTQNALSLQGDGVFFPKASTTSRLALTLTTTDKGFVVYDTTDSNIYFWNGTAWESVPGSGDAGANGSVQYNDNGIVSGATNFVWDKVNGRVGIGTATPSATLHTAKTAPAAYANNIFENTSATGYVDLGMYVGASGANGVCSIKYAPGIFAKFGPDANDTTTPIYLVTSNSTTRMEIAATGAGDVKINTGNLVIGTSGKGIDFSATPGTGTSELLADYEEGTFLPVVQGSTAAGVGVYSAQSGKYTKVGNLVTVQIYLIWSAHTGTGNIWVGNLPFTNASSYWSASVGYLNNIALTAGSVMTAFVEVNASYIPLWEYPTGGGASTAVPIDVAGGIILSASYSV